MSATSISVVLIVHDGERFLEEAIESVRSQTLRPVELVVVDDGSTDGTAGIIEQARRRDPAFLRVLRHAGGRNRGMSRTRNLGLAAARGEYTTFLDHDDAMLPTKLETLASALERHPAAVAAIGPNRRWHSWKGADPARDEVQSLGGEADRPIAVPGTLGVFLRDSRAVPLGPLIRTRVAREIGGYVQSFPGMHEDQAFFARLMLHGPIVLVEEPLHLYRQHDDSCVARTHRAGRDRLARRRFLLWLRSELARSGPQASSLSEIVEHELLATTGWKSRRLQRMLINLRHRSR